MAGKIDKRLLWWIFSATSGGIVRAKIVHLLRERPSNANQIAKELNLSYPTIRYHLKILEENRIIEPTKTSVAVYFLTDEMEKAYPEFLEIWKRCKICRER